VNLSFDGISIKELDNLKLSKKEKNVLPSSNSKINPPATSEPKASWPRRGGVFPRRHVFAE
jgi:hypothetical protein